MSQRNLETNVVNIEHTTNYDKFVSNTYCLKATDTENELQKQEKQNQMLLSAIEDSH